MPQPGPRKSTKSGATSPAPPRSKSSRPELPVQFTNTLLKAHKVKPHSVKTQELRVPGENAGDLEEKILIARVKLPTPKGVPGHVIKRFDTNAVSALSLFRAAYPLADEADQEKEMIWIAKGSHGRYGDTIGANMEDGPMNRQLSGTWVPLKHAYLLAEEYGLAKFTDELFAFEKPLELSKTDDQQVMGSALTSGNLSPVASAKNHSPVSPPPSVKSPRVAAKIKSPPSKRARVSTPPTSKRSARSSTPPISNGVSVHQDVKRDPVSGKETENTRVDIHMPSTASPARKTRRGAAAAAAAATPTDTAEQESHFVPEEEMNAHLEAAKDIVDNLKVEGVLSKVAVETAVQNGNKKRSLEEEKDVPADEDRRGFLGRLWKRRVAAKNKERGIKGSAPEDPNAGLVVEPSVAPQRRTAIAAVGLAVGLAATAAAPYFLN